MYKKTIILLLCIKAEAMSFFPEVIGKYKVGTTTQICTDPDTQRKILLHLWYPTASDSIHYSLYAKDCMEEWVEGLRASKFPEHLIQDLTCLTTYSIEDAPLYKDQKPYPLILFAHGYVALRSAYTSLCENLASCGYIVVGIAYPTYTQILKYPDGQIIHASADHISQKLLCEESSSKYEQQVWIRDTEAVLTYVLNLQNNTSSVFYNAIDNNKIAMIGHSFGGSTAIAMACNDNRITIAIDLDGGLFGTQSTQVCDKPLLFLLGERAFKEYEECNDLEISARSGFPVSLVTTLRSKYFQAIPEFVYHNSLAHIKFIPQANHGAFSDWVILKELSLYRENKHIFDIEKLTGKVNGIDTMKMIIQECQQFLEKYML